MTDSVKSTLTKEQKLLDRGMTLSRLIVRLSKVTHEDLDEYSVEEITLDFFQNESKLKFSLFKLEAE